MYIPKASSSEFATARKLDELQQLVETFCPFCIWEKRVIEVHLN